MKTVFLASTTLVDVLVVHEREAISLESILPTGLEVTERTGQGSLMKQEVRMNEWHFHQYNTIKVKGNMLKERKPHEGERKGKVSV